MRRAAPCCLTSHMPKPPFAFCSNSTSYICPAGANLQFVLRSHRLLPVQALTYAIERSCVNKAEVVAADEREGGVRATLNLGHTFGHAIETSQGYGGHRRSILCA